jgi:hypothetical protein
MGLYLITRNIIKTEERGKHNKILHIQVILVKTSFTLIIYIYIYIYVYIKPARINTN